jgi:hypothetical protein
MTQTETMQATAKTDEPVQEAQTPAKPLLHLWYHYSDAALLEGINAFFLHLQRRLPHVGVSFLRYEQEPTKPICINSSDDFYNKKFEGEMELHQQKMEKYRQQHQADLTRALTRLERTALLVPCVSPAFLEALDRDLLATPELAQALSNLRGQIMSIVVRPTETGASFWMRPLSSYADGCERETALKELVAVMERLLCDSLHIEPRTTALDYLFCSSQTVQPTIPSQTTTMELVLQALQPVQRLVEQATAQVVEARQLALAERAEQQTIQSLAQQVETLNQQFQAKQPGFWSRLLKKQE